MSFILFEYLEIFLLIIVILIVARHFWRMILGEDLPTEWYHEVKAARTDFRLIRMRWLYPDKTRFYTWWLQVRRLRQEQVPGAFAEVGVYRGSSARVLHHMDPSRPFHLFDTFTGFPARDLEGERGEAAAYSSRDFRCEGIEHVKRRIGASPNIIFHPGYYPDTAIEVSEETFALVNLDADLYMPTKAALEFFYPRLSPGGVIFIHDYNHKWPGVKAAVDEFMATIPETMALIPDKDSTVLIIRCKKV